MKIFNAFGIVFLTILFSGYAVTGHPRHVRGEVNIHVVDDLSIPVVGANVAAHYRVLTNADYTGPRIEGITDTNGMFCVVGEGSGYLGVRVYKNGYYDSRHRIPLGDYGKAKKAKLWPTKEYTVVLKKRRHPIPMYAKRVSSEMPGYDQYYGFDFLKCDWVKPYGEGENADVFFFHHLDVFGRLRGKNIAKVMIPDRFCGVRKMKCDEYSVFKTVHLAPENGYEKEWFEVLEHTETKIIQNTRLKDSEYLVIKCRPKYDDQGNLISVHYAKIITPFGCGQKFKSDIPMIDFTYYFNPTPNDRNLEFAPGKSLFPPSRHTDIITP